MEHDEPDWTTVIGTSGPELPAWIRHRVLALGEPARTRLVEIVRAASPPKDPDAPESDDVVNALLLLAQFPPDDELVALCVAHIRDHTERPLAFYAADLLAKFGPSVAPAVLAAYGRLKDDDAEEAAHLVDVLARCGDRDPRISAALLNALRRFPSGVAGLIGHYGDARMIEPLLALMDGTRASRPDDDDTRSRAILGAAASLAMLGSDLPDELIRQAEREADFEDRLFDDTPSEPFEAAPRPAANAPCRCGSGRKYKKCHMAQDEAAGG